MALAKLPRGKIKSYNDYGQDFFFFSFFSLHDAKKKLWAFSKKIFSLCFIKTFKKRRRRKQQSEKRKVLSIFFQTQEIQVLEKSTSNEKKSYASMAIIWP